MPSELRLKRVADRIQQEISEMLVTGQISDPRLANLYITDVTVDREFKVAKIYVSALGGRESEREIMDGLSRANGFLRSSLSRKIQLRTFPELRFIWDDTPENAERIERLIDSLSERTDTPDEKKNLQNMDINWSSAIKGGFIKNAKEFDAPFFGISNNEAVSMDPQHRKFLEVIWKTIEDAGYSPAS